MRILVTNDDGFYAAGIKQLKNALKDDNDVYLVAPDREKSAASHSLTLNFPLRINKKTKRLTLLMEHPLIACLLLFMDL